MPARRSKYPWQQWTDGDEHRIYAGEDYALSTMTMQISLHGHAKTHGLRVVSRSFTERTRAGNREGLRFTFTEAQG